MQTDEDQEKEKFVELPVIGAEYLSNSKDPFVNGILVTVKEIRGDYVRYQLPSGNCASNKIEAFNKIYKRCYK